MPDDATFPSEIDERIVRIENMRADTRLKGVQAQTEMWKVAATMMGVAVGLMGAGAGLFAAALAFARWWYGVGP